MVRAFALRMPALPCSFGRLAGPCASGSGRCPQEAQRGEGWGHFPAGSHAPLLATMNPLRAATHRLAGLRDCCRRGAVASATPRRFLAASAASQRDVENVTIFGSGLMGSGIAQVAAASGHKV